MWLLACCRRRDPSENQGLSKTRDFSLDDPTPLFTKIYKAYDKDGDGLITLAEFTCFLQDIFLPIINECGKAKEYSQAEMKQVYDLLCAGQSGLPLQSFIQLMEDITSHVPGDAVTKMGAKFETMQAEKVREVPEDGAATKIHTTAFEPPVISSHDDVSEAAKYPYIFNGQRYATMECVKAAHQAQAAGMPVPAGVPARAAPGTVTVAPPSRLSSKGVSSPAPPVISSHEDVSEAAKYPYVFNGQRYATMEEVKAAHQASRGG